MEEMFENKILDELYEIREGKVENSYLEKYGESKVEKKANERYNFFRNDNFLIGGFSL